VPRPMNATHGRHDSPSGLPRFVRDHWIHAFVLAIPLAIALTNTSWLGNPLGDVDTWLYNGYYKALRAFAANRAAWGPAEYYETRLPIIVPGAIVYGIVSDNAARYIFNLGVLHGIAALSFLHVVRSRMSRVAALTATAFFVTDIFYLRTVAWDYVDNAILVYQALTYALLTPRDGRSSSRARMIGAGFAAMSMLASNVGSVITLPALALYRIWVVEADAPWRDRARSAGILLAWGALGAVACLALYGAISVVFLNGPFAFWLEQLRFTQKLNPAEYAIPLGEAAVSAYWLCAHATVLIASIALVSIRRWQPEIMRSPLVRFGAWTSIGVYSLLITGEALKRTVFLARWGMYTSNFLFLAYLTIAAFLFEARKRRGERWLIFLPPILVGVAMTKLALQNGWGLSKHIVAPMLAVASVAAVAVVIATITTRAVFRLPAMIVIAASSLLVPWSFTTDRMVGAESNVGDVRTFILAGGTPPRVLYSETDPQRFFFISIASALTAQVVHDHYQNGAPIRAGEHVAVLLSLARTEDIKPCSIPGLHPVASRLFGRRYQTTAVYLFEATESVDRKRIDCRKPLTLDPRFVPYRHFSVDDLKAGVGRRTGDTITAAEGTPPGVLMTTSDLSLPAGTYNVTLRYAGNKLNSPQWDFYGYDTGSKLDDFPAVGVFVDSGGELKSVTIPMTLPARVDRFQVRSHYNGAGNLSIGAIEIDRMIPPMSEQPWPRRATDLR
jgi:hypothetical protein